MWRDCTCMMWGVSAVNWGLQSSLAIYTLDCGPAGIDAVIITPIILASITPRLTRPAQAKVQNLTTINQKENLVKKFLQRGSVISSVFVWDNWINIWTSLSGFIKSCVSSVETKAAYREKEVGIPFGSFDTFIATLSILYPRAPSGGETIKHKLN